MTAPRGGFRLERSQWVPLPIERAFEFFSRAENLREITPAWLDLSIRSVSTPTIEAGAVIDYRIRWLGLSLRWRTLIREFEPPRLFVDEQVRGPYRMWIHTHRFARQGEGTRIEDVVDYALPLGPIGRLAHRLVVRRQLENIFDYRARRVGEILGGILC